MQYDSDTSWINILFDTMAESGPIPSGNYFYTTSDTIFDGSPAFTGNSGTFKESQVGWFWQVPMKYNAIHDSLAIRFTMKSDAVNSGDKGWLIDDITLYIGECGGGSGELMDDDIGLTVYPNPVSMGSRLRFNNPDNAKAEIFVTDEAGRIHSRMKTTAWEVLIDYSDFAAGLYTIRVIREDGGSGSTRFILVK